MLAIHESMPPDIAKVYDVWRYGAGRNLAETARQCGMPLSTVHAWSQRYRWREQVAELDIEDRRDAIGHGWARLVRSLSDDIAVVERAIKSVYGPDGKPKPGDPTPTAAKTALAKLAMFGMAPTRTVTLDVTHTLSAGVTDAELDALLAAGDTASLLALASGKPLPNASTPPEPPRPPDFTSDQLGGRAGPGPTSTEAAHPDPPPSDDPEFGAAVLAAVFREGE